MRFPKASLCILISVGVIASGCAKKVAAVKPDTAPVVAAAPVPTPAPAPARAPEAAPTPNRVVAATPRPTTPDAATKARIQDLLDRIQDAYFDYNDQKIRPDAMSALTADAQTLSTILKDYPDYKLTIEGHCDERGSAEFNIALGEARAARAKSFLVDNGIPAGQLLTVSYGKEKPVCEEHDEACWQKNRRAHITQAQSTSR